MGVLIGILSGVTNKHTAKLIMLTCISASIAVTQAIFILIGTNIDKKNVFIPVIIIT